MHRVPWLLLNLCTATLAALVISQFEGEIERLVVLAVLMPIVASLGGNAAIQVLTVTVRAIAMRQVTAANALRVAASWFVNAIKSIVALLVWPSAVASARPALASGASCFFAC